MMSRYIYMHKRMTEKNKSQEECTVAVKLTWNTDRCDRRSGTGRASKRAERSSWSRLLPSRPLGRRGYIKIRKGIVTFFFKCLFALLLRARQPPFTDFDTIEKFKYSFKLFVYNRSDSFSNLAFQWFYKSPARRDVQALAMLVVPLASMLYPSPNGGRNDPYSM